MQAKDTAPSSDKVAHGGQDLAPWFLSQMAGVEASTGQRALNVFDSHYYPAQQGVALAPAGGANTQALRLRSVRSLWDPTYVDESFIAQAYAGIGDTDRVRLVPRMHEMINQNYPGNGLGIGEYNLGGLESVNGALAQADVLGVFAREGVDQANMWAAPHSGQPGAYAFRMFRNFDGSGGSFR